MNWALNVQVTGGPQIAITSKPKSIQAYDKIEVIIEPGDTERSVDIQPSNGEKVIFLLIKSSLYGSEITYLVNDGTDDSANAIALDEPHIYSGTGAIALLGIDPKILKFTNTHPATDASKRAIIEIFVGRDAMS